MTPSVSISLRSFCAGAWGGDGMSCARRSRQAKWVENRECVELMDVGEIANERMEWLMGKVGGKGDEIGESGGRAMVEGFRRVARGRTTAPEGCPFLGHIPGEVKSRWG